MVGDTTESIANLGLGHIAQRPILTTINDTTSVQAVAMKRVWTPALNEALRAYDWAFASSIVLLVESATYDPTIYGYEYAYVMPTSCAALRSVFNESTVNKDIGEKYKRIYDPVHNEELILTNVGGTDDTAKAYARYTYLLTDVTKWDASFVASFSYLLAAKASSILIGNEATQIQAMINLFNNSISETKRIDSVENKGDTDTTNIFVDSRM